MPGIETAPLREPRTRFPTKLHLMLIVFLFLTFLITPWETDASQWVDPYDLDIVEKDVLAVYIQPVLEEISANAKPLDRGNSFDLQISTNYTDPVLGTWDVYEYLQATAIWMQPESPGTYNLTVTFQTSQVWSYIIGFYARNADLYVDYYGQNLKSSGYFIQLPFSGPHTRPPGNYTISIILNSHRRSSPTFVIELPTPVNAVLFVTTAGFIAYFNIFLISDTYFKNKKEIVSIKRWLLCAIVIAISAVAIYQLYTFSTFTLSWSV